MRSDLIAQINLDHLRHNYQALRSKLAPGVRFCAPLKADAYGHGVSLVAPVLQDAGADCAAVATIPEAVELRQIGWRKPILVLGNVLAVGDEGECGERLDAIVRHRLTPTIVDERGLARLASRSASPPVEVHLKIDTGMGRMGAMPEEVERLIRRILSTPHLRLTGVYSHFATADFQQPDLARDQLVLFRQLMTTLSDLLPAGVVRHLANSAATITMPEAHFEMVRPGLALYGYLPAKHMGGLIDLKPILKLVSHVSMIKELPAGHCVGYAKKYTTDRATRLGIVPIGYFDGYVRALSNLGVVGIAGHAAPVIGRISMDQLAVDLTDIPAATWSTAALGCGSEAVLIDDRPDQPNSVAGIAERIGTIEYEVTCLLGRRIERISVGKNRAQALSNS